MSRITRKQAEALAEHVSSYLGLKGDTLCKSCERRGVYLKDAVYPGCRVYVSHACGGYSARIQHADSGESQLQEGHGRLRETFTFLQGMRAALLEDRS